MWGHVLPHCYQMLAPSEKSCGWMFNCKATSMGREQQLNTFSIWSADVGSAVQLSYPLEMPGLSFLRTNVTLAGCAAYWDCLTTTDA